MEADTIYLKTALQTYSGEYYTVVSEVLRKKSKNAAAFSTRGKAKKEDGRHWNTNFKPDLSVGMMRPQL